MNLLENNAAAALDEQLRGNSEPGDGNMEACAPNLTPTWDTRRPLPGGRSSRTSPAGQGIWVMGGTQMGLHHRPVCAQVMERECVAGLTWGWRAAWLKGASRLGERRLG